jgi:hypothetical protein
MISTSIAPSPVYATFTGNLHDDRELALEVWADALGERLRPHAAKYDWFYLSCPWGPPLLELLKHAPTGKCAGTCAAGPRRMLWQGREIRAGIMADMAISRQHRTLGPALLLQGALAGVAAARFDVLYGFPNAKSIAVANRAGYPVIGRLGRFSRVLRHGGYLGRRIPRLFALPLGWALDHLQDLQRALRARLAPPMVARWSDEADPRMDQLWRESPHGNALIAVRDAALLRWRFDACPAAKTRYLLLNEPGSERLLAWFACQVERGTLHVRDFWSRDAAAGLPRAQVDALLRAAGRDTWGDHAAVSLEYAAPASKLAGWLAAGFVERGGRPVVGRCLAADPIGFSELHFTAADEDE